MSIFFKENNFESTFNLFNKSIVYRGTVIRPQDNNIVNFHHGEKFLYGKIRRDGTPVAPIGDSVLKTITAAGNPTNPPQAMNFVVDVFHQMSLQFQKCVELNKISSNDPFLSNLVAYRGYVEPPALFAGYQKVIYNSIRAFFSSADIRLTSFEQFIAIFRDLMTGMLPHVRFTYPGFIKSSNCTILGSGLAIEIADKQNFSNDNGKIENFINSPNWDFYVNTCDSYGFMIDYNIPWRIVADIDCELMRIEAQKYGYVNPYDLLARAYSEVSVSYFVNNFISDLLNLYNDVKLEYWNEPAYCEGGSVGVQSGGSPSYTLAEIQRKFGMTYFLKLYLFCRLLEEKPEMPQQHKLRLIEDVVRMVNNKDTASAPVSYFERVINKEFDKIGSYTYLRKAEKATALSEFETQQRQSLEVSETDDISNY